MPEAYVKRVRITEQISDAIGAVGPIMIYGDDITDMCLYINVVEYISFPQGCGGGFWTDLSPAAPYMNVGMVTLEPWDVPIEETADIWVHLVFLPVDQRLP